jgi:methylase of polypeptide subunit release factors
VPPVDYRIGDLYTPVAGERFAAIVSNPPYVLAPEPSTVYEHDARRGNELAAALISGAGAHLEVAGVASMMLHWGARTADEDWLMPLRAWSADAGCRALAVHMGAFDPLAYFAFWNPVSERPGEPCDVREQRRKAWCSYLEDAGIAAVHTAFVYLRREPLGSERAGHVDSITAALPAGVAFGEVAAGILASSWPWSDAATRATSRIVRVSDAALTTIERGGEVHASLSLPSAGIVRAALDPLDLAILDRCDGDRSLSEVAQQLAAAHHLARDAVHARALDLADRLIQLGLVRVAVAGGA